MSIKLSEVSTEIKKLVLAGSEDGIYELVVEESSGILVDYTITKYDNGFDVVFDDRDLTPGLDTKQFKTLEEMVDYFDSGHHKPMILDSVDS